MLKRLDGLSNDKGKNSLGSLENGATIGYMSDFGDCAEVSDGEMKQRLYDDRMQLLGNYKTVLSKEDALQKAICKDLEEGLVSGPFSETGILGKYPKVLLNSTGAEIKDLNRPDVRTVADATQGVANQHNRLAMHPARPSLADAMRIIEGLKNPAAAKFDGGRPIGEF